MSQSTWPANPHAAMFPPVRVPLAGLAGILQPYADGEVIGGMRGTMLPFGVRAWREEPCPDSAPRVLMAQTRQPASRMIGFMRALLTLYRNEYKHADQLARASAGR